MLELMLLLSAALAQADVPPVPGLCSAPVPADREAPGCYQISQVDLGEVPTALYWQIYQFPTKAAAKVEAGRHDWSAVAEAHSRVWLFVLGKAPEPINGGAKQALIGPLHPPPGPVTAHFSEAIFSPGMQTRVHSHLGPEAFYVVEGEQCMETPSDTRLIPAGGTYVVESGPHIQAAPKGRRNLVLILAPTGKPAVIPGGDRRPTGFCKSATP
jgi:mannose-6-phosphate isomerase-like protein (cupin superfamily)